MGKGQSLAPLVLQGDLIRNITRNPPDGTEANRGHGTGNTVQADPAVTGNVIENTPSVGIEAAGATSAKHHGNRQYPTAGRLRHHHFCSLGAGASDHQRLISGRSKYPRAINSNEAR